MSRISLNVMVAKPLSVASFLILLTMFEGATAQSPPAATDTSPLDPSAFIRITLESRHSESLYVKRQQRHAIPPRGIVKVDFDRSWIRQHWTRSTRASIAIRGSITGEAGERPIEIPEYSVIGKPEKVVSLDVAAAATVLQLMQQGGRFANRIIAFHDTAAMASLLSQLSVVNHQIAVSDVSLRRTTALLAQVYARAANNALLPRDVEMTAQEMATLTPSPGSLDSALGAAHDVEVTAFFSQFSSQSPALAEWLKELTDPANAVLLQIIGDLVDRNPALIIQHGRALNGAMSRVDSGGIPMATKRQFLDNMLILAREVGRLERDLFLHYRNLNQAQRDRLDSLPQVKAAKPRVALDSLIHYSTDLGHIVDSLIRSDDAKRLADSLQADSLDKQRNRSGREQDTLASKARELAASFVVQVRGLSNRLGASGSSLDLLVDYFYEQLTGRAALVRTRDSLVKVVAKARRRQNIAKDVGESRQSLYTRHIETVEVVLLADIMDRLIDQLRPTYVSLSTLGLQRGDRLTLDVSTNPPRDTTMAAGGRPFEFQIEPRGWSGTFPVVSDAQFFARSVPVESNFSIRSGVAALWNWFGNTKLIRTVAPGVGFSVLFLQFGDQSTTLGNDTTKLTGSPIQVGIGPVLSLFNNTLYITHGWNLQRQALQRDNTNTVVRRSRSYWGIGIGLTQIVQKISGR